MHTRPLPNWVTALLLVLAVATVGTMFALSPAQESKSFVDVTAHSTPDANDTVVPFDDLTPAQQDLFERALDESDLVEDTDEVGLPGYVRYEGRTYRVLTAVAD